MQTHVRTHTHTYTCTLTPITHSITHARTVCFITGAIGLWGPKFVVQATEGTRWSMSTSQASLMLGLNTAGTGVVGVCVRKCACFL